VEDHGRTPTALVERLLGLRDGVLSRVDHLTRFVDDVAQNIDLARVFHRGVLRAHHTDHPGARQEIGLRKRAVRHQPLEGVRCIAVPVDEDCARAVVDLVDPAVLVLERAVLADVGDATVDEVARLRGSVDCVERLHLSRLDRKRSAGKDVARADLLHDLSPLFRATLCAASVSSTESPRRSRARELRPSHATPLEVPGSMEAGPWKRMVIRFGAQKPGDRGIANRGCDVVQNSQPISEPIASPGTALAT
jgi:hypothetical protein